MRSEIKVGLLFLLTIGLVAAFAFYLGAFNPFSNANKLTVMYNFAGGIEVGSPVRVMGIKVGRVTDIRFDPMGKDAKGREVKLKVDITVDKKAWKTVRQDSRFFINLAGVIGEKFIEISPGSLESDTLKPGQSVRGEDPPRVDQLISQSYGLAGKVMEFVESNETSVIDTINMMNSLVSNLNKTLKLVDKTTQNRDARKLIKNVSAISDDVAFFTAELRGPEGQKTVKLVNELIHRLKGLDAKTIKTFLQEEGIKAKLF
ncbi:MAG: MCE family protein [Bdellovibrionales bacterium]|nr:MCE family protein [Bdellovibrionales bacterium]